MPSLLLECGCDVPFVEHRIPTCPRHGVQRVVRTLAMPAPSFRGAVSGPHARTEDLGPFVGRLAGTGNEQKADDK